MVTVPHDRIWSHKIFNANDGTRTLMCLTNFYLEPNHDASVLRNALREVALASAYLKYDKPILVMVAEQPCVTHYQLKSYQFDLRG